MTALNRSDRSALRDMLTERLYTKFKAHFPDKKEIMKAKKIGKQQQDVAFVTGESSIVQARMVHITGPAVTTFLQVTCQLQVLHPEEEVVRVVFERNITSEQGRWRICDLIR